MSIDPIGRLPSAFTLAAVQAEGEAARRSDPAARVAWEALSADEQWAKIEGAAVARERLAEQIQRRGPIPGAPPDGYMPEEPPDLFPPEPMEAPRAPDPVMSVPKPRPLITPMTGFLAEVDEPVLDVVPKHIPADALTLWVGRKESFKTMTAMTLHAAVSRECGSWLGIPVMPMRSVYVSNEKRRRSVRERFRALVGDAPMVHDVGIVHRAGLTLDEGNAKWRAFVDEIEAMQERVLVTLDTLTSLANPGFKENAAEDMSRVLAAVRMLTSLPIPATVNLLHHPGWADTAGKEMRGRGHSSLEGEHDGLLSFDRPDRERDEGAIHVRPKDGDYRLILFAWERETMRIVRRDIVGQPLTITTATAIVRGLDLASVEKVREALGADPETGKPRFSEDRVRAVLNEAVTAGELGRTGGKGGRPAAYQVAE